MEINQNVQFPQQYKPLSPWGYLGYSLLFSIPLVGLILLIVFSFNNENINRRNYARSFWCALLVALILFVIVFVLSMVLGFSSELLDAPKNVINNLH